MNSTHVPGENGVSQDQYSNGSGGYRGRMIDSTPLPTPFPTPFPTQPRISHSYASQGPDIVIETLDNPSDPTGAITHHTVSRFALSRASPVWQTMFDVGTVVHSAETSNSSNSTAVRIPEATVDFESFLAFVTAQMGPEAIPLSFDTAQWKGILLVGHKYQNENAQQRAIAHLTHATDVTAAERFYMAVKFAVSPWLLPSAKLLAVTDIEDLSRSDEGYLKALLPDGMNPLRPLGVMKESIRHARDQLSIFSLPFEHDVMCLFSNRSSCKGKWDAVFSEHMKMFLQADWVSGRDVFGMLKAAKPQSGVTGECWDQVISFLETRQSLWVAEEAALDQGIRYMSGQESLFIP